jgi:hypothetical protein
MAWRSCIAVAVLSLAALGGPGCSPADDDGVGHDVPRADDGLDGSGGDADADADADADDTDLDALPEIPDYGWEACGVEDLPLGCLVAVDPLQSCGTCVWLSGILFHIGLSFLRSSLRVAIKSSI